MPPKKRDKDVDSSKAPRTDTAQADHELFLQAFEKPTQIYRFLRTRNQLSPVFLTRTLTYMRDRLSRNNQARKTFKVDSLLERLKNKRSSLSSEIMSGYMNLTFLGFYDKTLESHPANAQVETVLLKISHKKRKDSSSASMEVSFGTKEVPINPNETSPPLKVPTTSIPTDSFCLSDGSLSKSYILLLHVRYPLSETLPQNEDEPALKRRKSSGPGSNGNVIQRDSGYEQKLYGSELVVYDKHNRCLLSNGDYELVLDEVASTYKNSPRKAFSWDDFQSTDLIVEKYEPFECFTKKPLIKFNLSWSQEPAHSMVDRPQPYLPSENKENVVPAKKLQERSGQSQKDQLGSTATNGSVNGCSALKEESPRRLQIIYQFVYNNNSRQQTEACEDLHCPWCSLNCLSLYPLLKHLKLCHSRFVFTYVPIPQGARIDCAINELYDGSYSGSPHDLAAQPAAVAFSRNGPVRRAQVTNILVCRPKRPRPTLSEFLEPDDSELYDGQRPYITGHNRLYHHTTTCLPIYPKEMDVDSEGENDPEWLQHKTAMMIDEFTDVNEGEKELMKMWNLHVMRHGFVGDCQIPLACTMFLQAKGRELLMKNLYRNFILHLCSLFDFGLISPITLYGTVKKLHELVGETAAIRQVLLDSRVAQRDNWAATHSAIAASTSAGVNGSQTSMNNEKKEQNPKSLSVNNSCITPNKNTGRKVGTPSGAAQLRRKSAPPTQTTELPPRRRSGSSINEPVSKKRLSLSLKKDESLGGKALSS